MILFCLQDSLYMALSEMTLRECVNPEVLEFYDRDLPRYMEDEDRHPDLVRKPCIMKLEMPYADVMVCLNSKMYIAQAAATADRKAVVKRASKGLQHHTNPLQAADYKKVLDTKQSHVGKNFGFRMIGGKIFQYSQPKAALSYFYCKRIVHPDGISTSPLQIIG